MKGTFRIDSQVSDDQRAVYWDDVLSHHLDEAELQTLLKQARTNAWKNDAQDGLRFGQRLFQLLDRSGGQFSGAPRSCATAPGAN